MELPTAALKRILVMLRRDIAGAAMRPGFGNAASTISRVRRSALLFPRERVAFVFLRRGDFANASLNETGFMRTRDVMMSPAPGGKLNEHSGPEK